jgi:deoxyribose-phosphate aldolase
MMSDPEIARRILRCVDLTDLSENCSEHGTAALCAKALTPHGPVAAVCVWPQMVSLASAGVQGSSVRVATVVNFPGGEDDLDRVCDDIEEALGDGATEIDCVLPYKGFLRGDTAAVREFLGGVRDVVDGSRTLKIILETGALGERPRIEAASRLAIEAGADFLKTSTGKSPVAATPEAAEVMLEVIRASERPVGLKPSGGIRTLAQASAYLALADRIMSPGWATPSTFRIGASDLYDALIEVIEGPRAKTAED